ncbi:universal stress protein [Lentzea sp. NEAU-D7]|uniref:universal stress protein n=1 Tax=Lentzea sp. NEAU-D7 TaxID=2994667 RepID=UPI00224A5C9F|nr:universal stress protein [Lentzea sp. NEAU-D7]MCX2948901.1 universal stress protein [Lentzea sp. NEAU-D7]
MEVFEQRGNIVAGFDGSDQSREAVLWAAVEAARRSCPLLIVEAQVWPEVSAGHWPGPVALPGWDPTSASAWGTMPPFTDQHVRQRIEQHLAELTDQCRAVAPGISVSVTVVEGTASVALLTAADATEADLLVVGMSGLGSLSRTLLGSTAADLVHSTDRPVVVVRDAPPRLDAPVVLGVDGTNASVRAVGFAFDFAARHGCGVVAVHALSGWPLDVITSAGPSSPETDRSAARNVLYDEFLRPWHDSHPSVPVHIDVVDERPAHTLLDHSEQARLMVVGNRGRGAVRRVLFGSVSHVVLHHAVCPVAIVPGVDS